MATALSAVIALALSAATAPAPVVAATSSVQPHLKPIHGQRISQHQPTFRAVTGGLRQGLTSRSTAAPLGTGTWTSLGPQAISGLSTYGASAGRVTGLAAQGSRVYAGTAGGGVWRSTDGGTTWTPLTDAQPTLAIGAIAVKFGATAAADTIYVGTGEGNHCQDCLPSQGIISSLNGGNTWSAAVNPLTGTYHFFGLAIDRTNAQHLMAATDVGLYELTNGGTTWTQRQSGGFDTVVEDPSTASKFWASRTTDCAVPTFGEIGVWDTSTSMWASLWSGANPSISHHAVRIGLDVGPSGTAYASVASCAEAGPPAVVIGQSLGILKTMNSGTNWSLITPPDYFTVGPPVVAQGWYDNVVAIDPNDATGKTAVFGGITLISTTDGGGTFTDIAQPYNNGPVHADFHAVAFTGLHTFYTGNDGGINYTTDLGGTGMASDWSNKNATLNITQFYQGSSVDLTHLAGGSQDNGTAGNPQGAAPASWKALLNGDGFWTAMIPGQSTFFGESGGGDIFQVDYAAVGASTEVAPCSMPFTDPSCSEPTDFSAPYVLDPTSSSPGSARLYAATNRIYRTTTGGLPTGGTTGAGAAWAAISNALTNPSLTLPFTDVIHTMSIGSGSTSGTVMTGSWFGKVYEVTNGPTATATSWVDATGNLPAYSTAQDSGNAWITGVALNPLDRTEAWVTIGTLSGSRIWHTNNAGAVPGPTSWTDISTTLPANLVIDSITVDPIQPQYVYIGTDSGAMACATCGTYGGTTLTASWVQLGTSGLPNVRVDYISLTHDDVNLVAWTHGRGAWSLQRPSPTPGATLQPSSLDLGTRTLYTTSAPQTVTLSSTGTAPLIVSSIAVAGDFATTSASQTNPCGTPPFTLATGSSCNLGVTFTPTTTGSRAGTLAVYDNAVDSPQTTSLTGTGTLRTTWESLGGSLTSSPTATSWGASRLDLFARGRDLALYHMFWDGDTWHYWVRLNGTLSSDPVAVSWGVNRLDVFARGQDLALYHTWSTDGGVNWNYWERLGGTLASNPTASTWGVGRIDLFAAGQDKALYHMWTTDSGANWNYWTRLNGTLSSDPAAASWGNQRLDVFAAGQDKALYHTWSNDGGTNWNYWQRLGGTLLTSPTATTWGPNRLDCFALGQDKGMYHMFSTDGTTFGSWQPLGNSFSLNPTAASRHTGVVDAFGRGTDGALWHIAVTG